MAASTSAKMSFNHYQNGKYGTIPHNPPNDMEITQDMHLKMSKKIAQLTKVIYALNTKNDENDSVIQQLKEQHEEEMQVLLKETKEKMSVYRAKLDTESIHNKKIDQLESSITQHENVKQKYLSQFEAFKKHAEERETNLKTEHSKKMLELSQDVLHAKKDFEDKLRQFEAWKEGVLEEREQKLNDLRDKHQQEINSVRNNTESQNEVLASELKKVEDRYKSELEALHNKYENLEENKAKMAEDYEAKLAKAQLFYEKELEAVMAKNNMSQDDAQRMLQEEKEKMRKDFNLQESELKKQINSLLSQVTEKEDDIEKYKDELSKLTKSLQDKDSGSIDLNNQLQAALQEASASLARLKEVESQLAVMKERCSRQEEDMLHKSTLIGQLEATKLQNESMIQDLEGVVNKLRDKLSWLEKERENLERQKSDINQSQKSQLQSLEKALEDLSIEKQTMKEKYERELDSLRNRSSKSENQIQQQHQAELDKLRKQSQDDLAAQKKMAEDVLEQAKQDLIKKHTSAMEELASERDTLKAEFERVKSELTSRLKASEDEVARLNGMVQNTEQGLGSATGMINGLKDANNKLQQQLERARADHKEEKSRSASLQAELDKLRLQHDVYMKESKAEAQRKLDQLSADLDNKWQETLRTECNKLRQEIYEQKENEMRAALQQLSSMKDEEIAATRKGWENKVQGLMQQIDALKKSLESRSSESAEEVERLRLAAEEERKRLEQELLHAANDYLAKVQTMEGAHEDSVNKLREQKQQELEELQRSLQDRHIEDMQAQMSAHKSTLETVRDQAEKNKLSELQALRDKLHTDKEALKNKLYERHNEEMQRLNKDHEAHLGAARMELERAVEISKQKEKDHVLRVEDLQGEITQRERHIKNLKDDTGTLQTSIHQLNKEIDFKRQEINKIKSDTQNQIRIREKQLNEQMQKAMDNLQADHLRESQELVHQFNEAQEILKDKMSELQIMLQEAEEMYANRDSRPEDLELIEQLRSSILEKEERVKALIEEKKYYQMELVNRETNFNKVFNASPNVGVLNPLDMKKRKGSKGGTGSAPNLTGRLAPLPNSPHHNNQLNPSKPLPSFVKKFVK